MLINANISKELKKGKAAVSASKRKFGAHNDLIRSNKKFDKKEEMFKKTLLYRLTHTAINGTPGSVCCESVECEAVGAMHESPVTLRHVAARPGWSCVALGLILATEMCAELMDVTSRQKL